MARDSITGLPEARGGPEVQFTAISSPNVPGGCVSSRAEKGRSDRVRVGVLGAGAWARSAHLPGYFKDPRAELVGIADPQIDLAKAAAVEFQIPTVSTSHLDLIGRDDIDLIDVCTPSHTHFELAWAALEAGKHVLCEKPVAYDFRDTRRAHELARSKGLKTKVGFTFRYSPAMRYMSHLIKQGYVGAPFIFNGYEQNSQWLDPENPLRQVDVNADPAVIQVSSLEGYGAPIIDLGHWFVGSDLSAVVGTMRNFIPKRMVRATGRKMHMNIDDGDVFIGEFANGALCSVQTSFVTVGNYPGLEARVYGSEGALICRLVEEFGICETLKGAKPDAVEFRDLAVPAEFYPPGGSSRESWRTLFYRNLVSNFINEILDAEPSTEGDFGDAAWVQEVINAVELSFRERRWVTLPL
jgi:predicted dehydrogenase